MSGRTSPRAQAQEIYREMVAARATRADAETTSTPTPGPSPQGGGELTARVRALYEGGAVPVAEIAALAGVTERTIYKYAAKGHWTPRYAWRPDGGRPRGKRPPLTRGARWQAPARFAPVKGAGGRFVRRADRGKPVAAGLRATNAAAAARAAGECQAADALAREAQAQAQRGHWQKQRLRAWRLINRTLAKIADYEDDYKKQHQGQTVPEDDPLHRAMRFTLEAAMDWLAAVRREEAEGG